MTEVLHDRHATSELVLRRRLGAPVRASAAQTRIVAELGRAGLVWLATAVVVGSQRPLTAALVAVTLAASVWLVTLRAASALRTYLVSARMLSTIVGGGVGLAAVAVLNGSHVGLGLTWSWLFASAVAVAASTGTWDSVVDGVLTPRKRVLLVGADTLRPALDDEGHRCANAPFEIVASRTELGEEFEAIVEAQRPDIIVLSDERTYSEAIDRLLDIPASVHVTSLAGFFEHVSRRIPIEHITPAWFMCLVHPRQHVYGGTSKRVFDVLVAAVGLALAGPLLALLALPVKTSPGPILYRQIRVGERGRLFTLYKLRTMPTDAEADGACFARKCDERPTAYGRFLRRTHLDELPQLWNVLRGDMSIVGPRPERPEFVETLEATIPFWNRRLLVKPGLTGWAQLRCGYAAEPAEMAEKLSYDLWYLRNRSLALDLAICLDTIGLELRALWPRRKVALASRSAWKGVGR